MQRGTLIAAVLFGMLSLGLADLSFAQKGYPRYSPPSGPTITPYLNYFRQDVGAVGDPYNAFVVPRRQLDSNLSTLARQESANSRATQLQIDQLQKSIAAPTGVGAWRMNYSHYYSMPRRAH